MTPGPSTAPENRAVRSNNRLASLDWLRGIASVWVLFYHLDVTMQKEKYFAAQPLSDLAAVGYRGVDLFFLLSGFVMTLTLYGSKKERLHGMADFAIRRVFRIFPLYLIVFIALFVAAAITGVGGPEGFVPTISNFVWNALLLPRDDLTTYIPVSAWTLTHELMFYSMCIFGFYSKRLFWILLAVWSALCLLHFAGGSSVKNWAMPLSPLNIYFLLGAACAMLTRYLKTQNAFAWLGGGLLFLVFAIYLETQYFGSGNRTPYDAIVYASGFFAMTLSMAIFTTGNRSLLARILHYLGEISYALYLLHYPIIVVVAMVVSRVDAGPIGQISFVFLSIAVTLVASTLSFRLIENPGISLGKMASKKAMAQLTHNAVPA